MEVLFITITHDNIQTQWLFFIALRDEIDYLESFYACSNFMTPATYNLKQSNIIWIHLFKFVYGYVLLKAKNAVFFWTNNKIGVKS